MTITAFAGPPGRVSVGTTPVSTPQSPPQLHFALSELARSLDAQHLQSDAHSDNAMMVIQDWPIRLLAHSERHIRECTWPPAKPHEKKPFASLASRRSGMLWLHITLY